MKDINTKILVFLLVVVLFFANDANSLETEITEKKIVKIGILAKQGKEVSFKKWEPTAQYLSSEIELTIFEIVPLKFEEIVDAVSQRKIDFILANPSYYVELEYSYGVSRILTMRNLFDGITYTHFGGVMFYNKSRNIIKTYNEIKGKSVIAVNEQSFGGWRVSLHELIKNGINPKVDFKSLQFAGIHDSVVYAVKNGSVDVGFVRTGILEEMARTGKINIKDFGIIQEHQEEYCPIPFLHSTPLYPEWPLAKLNHISEEFAKNVALALLKLDKSSPSVKAAEISGWTVPYNYQSVHDCLKDLKFGPYKDFGKIILLDVLYKYRIWILVLFILVSFLLLSILRVAKLNKKLIYSKEKIDIELNERIKAEKSLEKVNQNLESLVKDRTSQLEKSNAALLKEIKEHKLVQLALLAEKEFSERIIDTSDAVIVGLSKDHLIQIFNKGAELVTGYTKDEVIGKDWFKIFFPENILDKMYKVWSNAWDSDSNAYENMIITKSKEERIISWQTTCLYKDKDREKHILLAIGEDITKKKIMLEELIDSKEKAVNADKMKSIFLAQMSHEIRTPINAIVSMSSLLKYDFEEIANDDQLMSFEIIDRAGSRIIRTVDLLLNLSAVQAGTYEISLTKFDIISDVISLIIVDYKKLSEKKSIKLSVHREIVDAEIVADLHTVHQIFVQLIDNAIKYTEKGAVNIKILRDKSEKLVVEIKDTGIGICNEYLPNLFTPFSQEQMGYTRKFEGNGIGLALVKKYCDLNNAKLEVESKKDEGSIFKVVFN